MPYCVYVADIVSDYLEFKSVAKACGGLKEAAEGPSEATASVLYIVRTITCVLRSMVELAIVRRR